MRLRLRPTIIFLMSPALVAGAAGAVTLFVTPDCPSPADCAATLSVAGSASLTARLNHPVPSPLRVQVLDAQQRPVPGVTVHFTRLDRPEDISTPDEPAPDVTLSSDTAITDNSGLAQVTAAANDVAGSYQYVALVMRGPETLKAYFVLANRPRTDGFPLTPVVEYVNLNDGHYFFTADAGEMSKLDSGVLTGWVRTGSVFSAFLPDPKGITVDSKSVCRFYGRQHDGSHFPSALPVECQAVRSEFGEASLLESDHAFSELLPDPVSGECPTGSRSLYSAYKDRHDANQRYSPSIAVIHALVFDGWIAEGYGPNAVAMCFPE